MSTQSLDSGFEPDVMLLCAATAEFIQIRVAEARNEKTVIALRYRGNAVPSQNWFGARLVLSTTSWIFRNCETVCYISGCALNKKPSYTVSASMYRCLLQS